MGRQIPILVFVISFWLSASVASAQVTTAAGWFGNDEDDSVRTSSYFSDSKKPSSSTSSWKPSWKMPWFSSQSKSRSKSKSMFGRMSSTSKKWWGNTVDFMNPFNDGSSKPQPHGYQSSYWGSQTSQSQTKESSWWPWAKQEEEPIESVNDFLRLSPVNWDAR